MGVDTLVATGSIGRHEFSYYELACGFAAIGALTSSIDSLIKQANYDQPFEQAASFLLDEFMRGNQSLMRRPPSELTEKCSFVWGKITQQLEVSTVNLKREISEKCSYFNDGALEAKVLWDITKPIFLELEQNRVTEETCKVLSRYFYSTLDTELGANFWFVDLVTGGNAFPFAQKFVSEFPGRTTGRVITDGREFERVLERLAQNGSKSMIALGDDYESAAAYNAEHEKKIEKNLLFVLLNSGDYRVGETVSVLSKIALNREKNNTTIVLIAQSDVLDKIDESPDFYIRETHEGLKAGRKGNVVFGVQRHSSWDDVEVNALLEKMKSYGKVDTAVDVIKEKLPPKLSLDSTRALRIPFAIGDDGEIKFFEIGGEAAAHALISGKTGSGKSVALHTLMMQIASNYHPDDVEIWAIDYKAVEFDWYMQHPTPHFKVIARDSSDEFTYSLLDLIDIEYRKRKDIFLQEGVKNISEYRAKKGAHSMPRIVIFIDEFQIMTQAVQAYTGDKDYRKLLENHLRLTRAMGISFVFCSQTVASGLGGLTEAARSQIGCRLCLQQQSGEEIRETLAITGSTEQEAVKQVENLRSGQAVYKRSRWKDEHAADGSAFETCKVSIIFMSDEQKLETIDQVNCLIGDDFKPKETVFVKGSERGRVLDKPRHPMTRSATECSELNDETLVWYPGAPTTLADGFPVALEDTAGSNILLVGESDDLRESIVTHSIIAFLLNPSNRVVANFVNEDFPDRRRMIEQLKRIRSNRFDLRVGVKEVVKEIESLKTIRPSYETRRIDLWYGLDRLDNELFLLNQTEEAENNDYGQDLSAQGAIDDLTTFLESLELGQSPSFSNKVQGDSQDLTFDQCKAILRRNIERGPENNQFHFLIFNNRKGMKKSGFVDLGDFDYRIGSSMSSEDTYDIFGTSAVMEKADEQTVVFAAGGKKGVPLRPYLMPSEEDIELFNDAISVADIKSDLN